MKNPTRHASALLLFLTCLACPGQRKPDPWGWGPVLPQARTGRVTAVAGGLIVTAGGTWWEDTARSGKVKHWATAVHALEPQSSGWRALPAYPVPVGEAFAAAIGSKFYVIGGRGETAGNAGVNILDVAAPDAGWEPGPGLPRPRWGTTGAVIDGVIYLLGGVEGDPQGESRPAGDVVALDPRRPEKGWQRVAQLPDPLVEWPMAAGGDGVLYLFGGMASAPEKTDKGYLPRADAYALDLKSRRWRKIRPLPIALGSGAATAVDRRRILLTGGYALAALPSPTPDDKTRTYYSTACFLYDTVLEQYNPCAPLSLAVVDHGLGYWRGKAYVVGGEDTPYRTRTDLVQVGSIP